MAKCNASILTSFAMPGTIPLLFALNASRISRPIRTTFTANVLMEQQGIDRIAKNVVLKAEEKAGQDLFIQPFLQLMSKLAKFATLTSRLQNFMQMVVLRMAQKNTAADAKVAYLQKPNKNGQKIIHQKHKKDLQVLKILSLASLIMQQIVNNILNLILILFTFLSFTKNSKGFVLCQELR
jgi:hypothetical protein